MKFTFTCKKISLNNFAVSSDSYLSRFIESITLNNFLVLTVVLNVHVTHD